MKSIFKKKKLRYAKVLLKTNSRYSHIRISICQYRWKSAGQCMRYSLTLGICWHGFLVKFEDTLPDCTSIFCDRRIALWLIWLWGIHCHARLQGYVTGGRCRQGLTVLRCHLVYLLGGREKRTFILNKHRNPCSEKLDSLSDETRILFFFFFFNGLFT